MKYYERDSRRKPLPSAAKFRFGFVESVAELVEFCDRKPRPATGWALVRKLWIFSGYDTNPCTIVNRQYLSASRLMPERGHSQDEVMEILNSTNVLLAYFDAGSGSLVLQAIVGGAAGLIVFARYIWDALPWMRGNRQAPGDANAK